MPLPNKLLKTNRKTMKRRVQAQRKFAQGAILPPSQPEKRVECNSTQIQAKPFNRSNVTKNESSAKTLLDSVSFNKLHGHKLRIPVLVLERIETDPNILNKLKNDRALPKSKETPKKKDDSLTTTPQKRLIRSSVLKSGSSDEELLVRDRASAKPNVINSPRKLRDTPKRLSQNSLIFNEPIPNKKAKSNTSDRTTSVKLINNADTRSEIEIRKDKNNSLTNIKQENTQEETEIAEDRNYTPTISKDNTQEETEVAEEIDYTPTISKEDTQEETEVTEDTIYTTTISKDNTQEETKVAEDRNYTPIISKDNTQEETEVAEDRNYTPTISIHMTRIRTQKNKELTNKIKASKQRTSKENSSTQALSHKTSATEQTKNLTVDLPRTDIDEERLSSASKLQSPTQEVHPDLSYDLSESFSLKLSCDGISEQNDAPTEPHPPFTSTNLEGPQNNVVEPQPSTSSDIKNILDMQDPSGNFYGPERIVSWLDKMQSPDTNTDTPAEIIQPEPDNNQITVESAELIAGEGYELKSKVIKVESSDTSSIQIAREITKRRNDKAVQVNAPIFYPTEAEFTDPIAYFESIMPTASKYGICKVVAPKSFKPTCHLNESHRFNVTNQYLSRLYSRWGPGAREMCAIKAYLASQGVVFNRPPLIEGMEVNLPKLNHVVQRNGGLKTVIEKKKWGKVAEEMRLNYGPNPDKKLDHVYVKYLLPYGTLSAQERHKLTGEVEKQWFKKNRKLLDRALKPLHRQRKLLGESESSGEDSEEDEKYAHALAEAEDCIVPGRKMNLTMFKKVAETTMRAHFPDGLVPSLKIEQEFWRLVLLSLDHVCVNAASIDSGDEGHGFTINKTDPYGKHPWNLKVLSTNPANVLHALGRVLGLTVPTLHLGMVFSTSCWHSDPQGLPWVEYLHQGASKIWYGIAESESNNFRRAVETLCPTSCQNKSTWLPSDISMIPPDILCQNMVSLARVEQKPGEYVIVCPKAYSCSIATGYCISESVYFAPTSWLNSVHQVFQELRDSCEPTMFSLEQLMFALVRDDKTPLSVLQQLYSNMQEIISDEISYREELRRSGVKIELKINSRKRSGVWNVRDFEECEICRTTLYLSSVSGIISKKSTLCSLHAMRLLSRREYSKLDKNRLIMYVYFSESSLYEYVKNIEDKLLHRPITYSN